MVNMKTYDIKLHTCGCGYETVNTSNANRHQKTKCGHEMKTETKIFLLQEEVTKLYGNTTQTNITVPGDHNTVIGKYIDNKQITINLTIPDGDTRTVIYKALKSPQFQRDLNGEFQPENIPALIFRHTKGLGNTTRPKGEKLIHVEDDKVHEKDSGGAVVKTTLNKYARKFINDATCAIENNIDIIQPKFAKELVEDLKTPNLPGHKRGEKVSGAEALKNYATGAHVVYKYPPETKGFVDRAVDAVKNEIRHANG
ncbi:protein of unknown function (DUF1390) [Paramecium bursaria Chlorella virus NY2B]|uniref:Uncharacterized protein n=1 Tax=Paramecium bursaria Chlorella virus NYs1 TaxID=83442 RepID=M1I9G2_9PHYC|nr:hypothetical protein AR158_C796L [Paramecium bursaria Chlorella virus AR158]YP_009665581.1 protein of unknown function (DUF1390) [Paramecium bursaria Chlorella virus NYs1]AGE55119.1 protein of unknown function (DUF1390) [Paramecium bursaria Chlorella virus MA1D]AGE58559.1 protein of unknown function (DUF1390) [Paramecium bursaria Chlorella virus NY2B]ABU44341.1 hypothetical protein AR158_C796L [Paramecium bursaria Chlorella virus AR158]AGE58936.1 protein of unknown function (DUF1390) [Param